MTDSPFSRVRDPFAAPAPTARRHRADGGERPQPIRSVAFVCTGNICRSAYAEALLRWLVPDLEVRSGGILPMRGEPMDPLMAAELQRRGVPSDGHRAREASGRVLDADLILTMTDAQRGSLLEEHPALARRVGLLGAIDQLRATVPAGRAATSADVAPWAHRRARAEAEIADPYQKGPDAADAAARQLDAAVDVLADLLAPSDPTPGSPAPAHERNTTR